MKKKRKKKRYSFLFKITQKDFKRNQQPTEKTFNDLLYISKSFTIFPGISNGLSFL